MLSWPVNDDVKAHRINGYGVTTSGNCRACYRTIQRQLPYGRSYGNGFRDFARFHSAHKL